MELVTYLIAAGVGFFGIMFVVGSQGQILRIIIGLILLAAAGVLVYLTRVRPKEQKTTIIQKVDVELTGDVNLKQMKCRNCGGALDKEAIKLHAGALFITCPYCGANYQFEEQAKW